MKGLAIRAVLGLAIVRGVGKEGALEGGRGDA